MGCELENVSGQLHIDHECADGAGMTTVLTGIEQGRSRDCAAGETSSVGRRENALPGASTGINPAARTNRRYNRPDVSPDGDRSSPDLSPGPRRPCIYLVPLESQSGV